MTNLADLLPAGGGQNNTDFVADGNISSGAPVILTAAGKAAAVSESSISASLGTPVNFYAASTQHTSTAFDSTNNKVVVAYRNGLNGWLYAVVGTVSGSAISWGTPVAVNSGTTEITNQSCVFDSSQSKIVIVYKDNAASDIGNAIVGEVSGTSISFGSEVTFNNATTEYPIAIYDSNAQKVVIAYRDSGNSNYGTAIVGTVSGTSISFGSESVFLTQTTDLISGAFDSSTNQIVLSYRDYASSLYYGKSIVGAVSGTSISFGSQTTFESATIGYTATAYDSAANKIVVACQDVGNSYYGTAIVGTVSGTSISFGSPVVFNAANPTEYIGACFDANVGTVTFIFTDGAGGNYYPTYIVGTVSGNSISFATKATVATNSYSAGNSCAVDTTSNKVILGYAQPGVAGAGAVLQPSGTSSNLTSTNLLGIASGAISDTATGTINTWGSRNEVQTGLTIGSDYYVQTDGRIEAGVTNIAYDISSATYTQNFSVSSQSTDPVGLLFSPDGTSMYVVSGVFPPGAKNIFQYALTTAFDISTASLSKDFDASGEDSQARGIQFNLDGTKMFINGVTGDAYYQYSLSSAYDISTGSYDSVSFSLSSQDGNMEDVVFNADGTKFYGVGLNTYAIYQYSCSSAFDLSTASYDSVSFSISSQDNSPRDLFFKPDGSKMWLLGRQNNSIYQYSLSSAFDLSTASYDSISFSVSSEETTSGGLAFSANGEKFYVCGGTGDDVNQYATTANSFSTDHLIGKAITATQINIKDYTG